MVRLTCKKNKYEMLQIHQCARLITNFICYGVFELKICEIKSYLILNFKLCQRYMCYQLGFDI